MFSVVQGEFREQWASTSSWKRVSLLDASEDRSSFPLWYIHGEYPESGSQPYGALCWALRGHFVPFVQFFHHPLIGEVLMPWLTGEITCIKFLLA